MDATVQTIEAMERPPVTMASRLEGELLEVSMGPQHPSTHGVFRMNVALEGEIVRKLKPVFGYLHRNHEQIGEHTSYLGSMPYTDRLDYFCSMTNNWAYAMSVEKLAGIEVPERAEYLRVNLAELKRLQNHASLLGFLLSDMGAWCTPLMYAFREREKILDLFESLSGSRMMCDYMRFGGCRVDASDEWLAVAKKIVDRFPKFLDEFEELILQNEIVIARTQNVGKLSPELAISAGITGPKGELGFYLISDGGSNPYRYRVRPPSFINLTVLEDLCLGHTVADVMVILGSVDIVMGEVDR